MTTRSYQIKNLWIFFLTFYFLVRSAGASAVHDIAHVPGDQSDPTNVGSIAWYFENYDSDATFRLTDLGPYHCHSTLEVPANATLTACVDAVILADGSPIEDGVLMRLSDGVTLENLGIDGNRLVKHCIDASHTQGVLIESCSVSNTNNNYNDGGRYDNHIIYLEYAVDPVIRSCAIFNAGCNPIINPGLWDSTSVGIYGQRTTNMLVEHCAVRWTMGASVVVTRTQNAVVRHNVLFESAQCNTFNGGAYSHDSIIGYHNTGMGLNNLLIECNEITKYRNHGIHVSGEGITIVSNTIYDGDHQSIRVHDQKTDPYREVSRDIHVADNIVAWGTSPDGKVLHPIKVGYYKSGTFTHSNNRLIDIQTGVIGDVFEPITWEVQPNNLYGYIKYQNGQEYNISSGYIDWTAYGVSGASSFETGKNGASLVGSLISLSGAAPTNDVLLPNDGWDKFTWSNGDDPVSAINNLSAVKFGDGVGSGWTITVPASANKRRLILWTYGYSCNAILTASISDGSEPDLVEVLTHSPGDPEQLVRNRLDIIFKSAQPGTTVTISMVVDSLTTGTNGHVGVQAAALENL